MAATAAALDPARLDADRAATNRANSLHSTGPVTPEGKAASSRNATTHGIFACIDTLPPHEREIFDLYLARFQPERLLPGLPVTEAMTEVTTRWAILRYRMDKCHRQEITLHVEMVRRLCEAQDIPVPTDPKQLAALGSRAFLDDLYAANAIMRLRNYELRLDRQIDKVIAEFKALQRAEAAAAPRSSRPAPDLASFFQRPEFTSEAAPEPGPEPAPKPPAPTPRSADCPCGSGYKYKRCCGKGAPPVLSTPAR